MCCCGVYYLYALSGFVESLDINEIHLRRMWNRENLSWKVSLKDVAMIIYKTLLSIWLVAADTFFSLNLPIMFNPLRFLRIIRSCEVVMIPGAG